MKEQLNLKQITLALRFESSIFCFSHGPGLFIRIYHLMFQFRTVPWLTDWTPGLGHAYQWCSCVVTHSWTGSLQSLLELWVLRAICYRGFQNSGRNPCKSSCQGKLRSLVTKGIRGHRQDSWMATNFEARADKTIARIAVPGLVGLSWSEAWWPRRKSSGDRLPAVWFPGRSLYQSISCLGRHRESSWAGLLEACRETPSPGHNRSQAQNARFIQWSWQRAFVVRTSTSESIDGQVQFCLPQSGWPEVVRRPCAQSSWLWREEGPDWPDLTWPTKPFQWGL